MRKITDVVYVTPFLREEAPRIQSVQMCDCTLWAMGFICR